MKRRKEDLVKKTKEQLLNQIYLTPQDLKELIPTYGIEKCRDLINDVRQEMEEKNFFVPTSKPKLALTKLVKKKIGL